MQKYSNLQIWLHWIVFILILGQFVFHEPISEAFELRLEGQEVVPSALIGLHLVFGGVVFLLIVTRLWVRMGQGVPSYPKENAALMELASKIVHWSFYGVLLLLPISGGFAWFQLSEGAGNAHELLKTVLLLLLFLHVGASLFHYFVLKSNLFKRCGGNTSGSTLITKPSRAVWR